jgi:hypothetical protein
MSHLYKVSPAFAEAARVRLDDYRRMYRESLADPDAFWARMAGRLQWVRSPTRMKDTSFALDDFRIRWYADGKLNVSVNCLDRHLAQRGDKTAIIFEGDDPKNSRSITYRELHARVCRRQTRSRPSRSSEAAGHDLRRWFPTLRSPCSPAHASARSVGRRDGFSPGRSSGGSLLRLDGGHHRGRGHPRRHIRSRPTSTRRSHRPLPTPSGMSVLPRGREAADAAARPRLG